MMSIWTLLKGEEAAAEAAVEALSSAAAQDRFLIFGVDNF